MPTSKAISSIIKMLNAKGEGMDASTVADSCVVTDWFSTGSLALDAIMGGGLPIGRVTEIRGAPSSGKSLIAVVAAALAQQNDAITAIEDSEGTVSRDMARKLGLDTENCIYVSHSTIEEVFEFFESMVQARRKYGPDKKLFLAWDSVAATSVKQEEAAEYGKATMGRHAQIISQSLRKFCHVIKEEQVCCLFLNQTRQKIGVMFGDNTTTFGGEAIPFHASVRINLDISSKIKSKDGKHVVGMNTLATCIKNKVAMPFRKCYLPIYFGSGIDDAAATFVYMKDNGLITLEGKTYKVNLGDQGEIEFAKKQWRQLFNDNFDIIADVVLSLNQEVEAGSLEVAE